MQMRILHPARKVVKKVTTIGRRTIVYTAAAFKLLNARELQIVDLINKGLSYTEIGEELGIPYNTVEQYYQSIYWKLGISSRWELFALNNTKKKARGKTNEKVKSKR